MNLINIRFQDGLTVIYFVGVNEVGKKQPYREIITTTNKEAKKVMLVAADTFVQEQWLNWPE